MTMRDAIRNFRTNMLEEKLASVKEEIRLNQMHTQAAKVAEDGQSPTLADLAKYRQKLYTDQFQITEKLNALRGPQLAYQTLK